MRELVDDELIGLDLDGAVVRHLRLVHAHGQLVLRPR